MRRLVSLPYLAWRARRIARQTPARFVDLLRSAKHRTPAWIVIPLLGLIGLNAAAVYSWTIPDTFVATSIIGIGDSYIVGVTSEDEKRLGVRSQWWFTDKNASARMREITTRNSLARLIHEEGLYQKELAQMPEEDLFPQMESAIEVRPVKESRNRFALSFSASSAVLAQGAAVHLANEFVDGTSFSLLESASLPIHHESPQRLQISALGLLGGVLAGSLALLLTRLRVWKLALALGVAGAAFAFMAPAQYTSTALVTYRGPGGWSQMRELISRITSDSRLEALLIDSGVYENMQGASTRLLEHLRIKPTEERDAKSVAISFVDSRPLMAQTVAARVAGALVQNSSKTDAGFKVELFDPADLPSDPSFPDRPLAAGVSSSAGFACAIALGIWRRRKGSYPWDAKV